MSLPNFSLSTKLLIYSIAISAIPFLSLIIFGSQIFQNSNPSTLNLQELLLQILILIVLNVGFLFASFIWLFQNVIYPLKQIKDAGYYLSKGHYNYNLPKFSNDEIGKIVEAFNYLSYTLSEAVSKESQSKNIILNQRNQLALIIASISDALITVDDKYNVILFNKAAEELTGYKSANVLNKNISNLIKLYDGSVEIPVNTYCPSVELQPGTGNFTKDAIKVIGLGNKETTVSIITKQLKQDDGQLRFLITLKDTSKEKDLESMKLDFVSMAAHELRTPLTSIKGYLQVYRSENDKSFNDEQKMFLDRISIATQQLSALVENILSVAKIERGNFTITTTDIDWVEFVRQLVIDLTMRANAKRITLSFIEPTTKIPHVQVDKIRINEVISNILSNAINYTDVGGEIKVWVEAKDGFVITNVKDNGVGLAPDSIAHLFGKFYRIQGKLEGTMKGNGLGLYITKSIVELHKGQIWATSEGLGKGSTFSFSLPIPKNKEYDLK